MNNMPVVNFTELTEEELELAKGIAKKDGTLRASKPKTSKQIEIKTDDPEAYFGTKFIYSTTVEAKQGETAYIWRMVAFAISTRSQHQCMPCTADFWLEGTVKASRRRAKELDVIVEKILKNHPVQPGIMRWGKALGYA